MNLQEKAAEIFKKYENLLMRDKIGTIAQAFGCTYGEIVTSPCYRKWQGTSDIYIRFDNGASLGIGNEETLQANSVKVQNEYVNAILLRYNPEIVAITKETALAALREQAVRDNKIAQQKGLKPYTMLNVEFNDGADDRSSGYMGWYYVTIAVDDKIRAHLESGLSYQIASGKAGEVPVRDYFTAGAVKEADVDFIFNNVGFSSTSTLYSLPIPDDVLRRAEKTLAERGEAKPHKPSIKAQLASKPAHENKPAAKNKDREVR